MAITKISPSVVDFDDGITISTDDNSNNLTLTSTDADSNAGPILDFYRNSGSPAVGDLLGRINFRGRNDNSQDVNYAAWHGRIFDETDGTEDGSLRADIMYNGTVYDVFTLYGNEVVINESSNDIDFRVESDANANAFFVDGGQNAIGIQTATEHDGTALVYPLTINAGNHSGNALEVHRSTNSRGYWYASDTGTHYLDVYGSSSPNLRFRVAGSDVAKVTSAGICFGSDTAAANALDDYEEGTFTPAFDNSVTVASATGRYTKIGRIVNFSVEMGTSVSNITGGVSAGITGLPFSVASNQAAGSCFSQYVDNGPFTTVYVYTTGPKIFLYEESSGAYHPMQFSDMNDSSAFFYMQGTYISS